MQTIELTEKEISHRNACAYLKGYIVQLSTKRGMKWESTKEPSESFQAGYDKASERSWFTNQPITLAHIIHNRLRHNRPHTGSLDSDNEFIAEMFSDYLFGLIVKKLKEDLSPVLSEDEITKILEVRTDG